jgi:hypothetical protein
MVAFSFTRLNEYSALDREMLFATMAKVSLSALAMPEDVAKLLDVTRSITAHDPLAYVLLPRAYVLERHIISVTPIDATKRNEKEESICALILQLLGAMRSISQSIPPSRLCLL